MLFTEFPLDERLQRALVTAGFVTPTPIQAAALPVALEGRDLLGTAQTGTGKTAAFVLPILQRLIAAPHDNRRTRAVILAPTRELVEQILAVVRELGLHTNIRAVAVYGGVPMQQQTRALRNGVELVIACPGRLLDHIKRRNADLRFIDTLVLDEADRMLDMGFLPSIEEIIDNLPAQRQTMLFSATFAKSLNAFVEQTLTDPVRVAVDTAVAAQSVRHTLYQVKGNMKTGALTLLLHQLQPDSDAVLIFTKTRVTANQVADHLYAAGLRADVLHAEKTQRARQETLDRFRAGVFPYLVATDIAARGIDVTSITHVINFDLPSKADDYLHRIGRTGRMERAGHAISLMTRGDIRALRDIERMLGKKIEVAQFSSADLAAMPDVTTIALDNPVRPPHHHVVSRATDRPLRTHHHDEEHAHRAPRDVPAEATAQQTARPERPRRDAAPRQERPRRSSAPDTAPAAPARAERPGKRYGKATLPGAEQPYRTPRRAESSDHAQRADRPQRPRDGAAPLGQEYPRRRHAPSNGAPAVPARTERPGANRDAAPPSRGARPPRRRDADTPPVRSERPRGHHDNERPAGRPPRPDRADRRPRHAEATTAPKRRDHVADPRVEGATPAPKRQERSGGRKFTGMASVAKHHRQHGAGKRKPGEIPSTPRPYGKSGA